ncbi:hypothetical protein [Streptomyces sp. NPDC058678]|uniref:hypothetical protein n=1 Tax=Streptomyces sp. NPDC058678 TaxID=3346595 RepID=UPI00364EA3E3
MTDPQFRDQYLDRRADRDASESQLMGLLAAVQRLESVLAAAGGADPALAQELADAQADAAAMARHLDEVGVDAEKLRAIALDGDEFVLLDRRSPVLLLPVRLEARAGSPMGDRWDFDVPATHLVVRIFPDQCHLDAHDPLVTDEEARWIREYVQRIQGLSDHEDLLPAWTELVRRAGPNRARWLAALRGKDPGRRPAPWGRGVRARLLPDRWHVRVTFDDGAVLTGVSATLVREPLPAGPDPRSGDTELAWVRDLGQAFASGMAAAVDLQGRPPGSVRRVTCVGGRAGLTGDVTRRELGDLLTAHRFTDGLSVLKPANPTTSTERGRVPRRDDSPATLADVHRDARRSLTPTSAGARLTGALGLDTGVLLHVDGADAEDLQAADRLSELLIRAVQAGITDLLSPPVPASALTTAFDHARAWVSALGPLPTLRAGAQPYGILPVRRILHARPDAPVRANPVVVAAERFRREIWEPAMARSPRVQPGLRQPERTLVELLRRDGAPTAWTLRLLAPDPVSTELLSHGPAWHPRWEAARDRLAVVLGVPAEAARALGLALAPGTAPVTVPLVTSDTAHPAEYLTELLSLSLRELSAPAAVGAQPLLYHLARAALLEAADVSVQRAAEAQGGLPTFPRWSSGVSTWEDEDWWTVRDRLLNYGLGNQLVAEWLDANLTDPRAEAYAQARDLVFALGWLSAPSSIGTPPVDLEPVLRAVLGLGHRIDAWYTSLAWQRLSEVRETGHLGLSIGAYGVLDGFLPAGRRLNGGYIHAPGPTHAATAAVLRSAHLARSTGQTSSAAARTAAVNLSSRRVRAALALLDGIRTGQSLSELLGQHLEEALTRADRHVLIAPLRARFPLVAGRLSKTHGGPKPEAVAAPAVVDGHAALTAAGFPEDLTVGAGFLPAYRPLSDKEASDLRAALDALADEVDAMGDVLLAEGIYQIAQGNMARAAATMDFLAGAPVGVPDPEVTRTPRTAQARQVRLAVIMPGDTEPGSAWPVTPRSAVEPRLAAWVAAVLPPPDHIDVVAETGSGQVNTSLADLNASAAARSQKDLLVGPLDLALPPGGTSPDSDDALSARLAALLALHLGVDRATLTVQAADGDGGLSVRAAVEAARRVGELALGARPLEPADLRASGEAPEPLTAESDQLVALATAARASLDTLAQRLATWNSGTRDPEQIVGLLAAADHFGIPGALPAAWDESADARLTRAAAAQREAARRVSAVPTTVEDAQAAIRTLFGGNHIAMPLLRVRDAAWTVGVRAQTGSAQAAFARWARVRSSAARLELVDLVARAGGRSAAAINGIGLPATAPASGTTTLLSYEPVGGAWNGDRVCGLALDSWVDATPAPEETTGIVFHAEAPVSEPPNLWLIAVPEANNDRWSADDLFTHVDEALDLARLRAVSPADLEVDHLVTPWLTYAEPRDPGPVWGTVDPDRLTRPPS